MYKKKSNTTTLIPTASWTKQHRCNAKRAEMRKNKNYIIMNADIGYLHRTHIDTHISRNKKSGQPKSDKAKEEA